MKAQDNEHVSDFPFLFVKLSGQSQRRRVGGERRLQFETLEPKRMLFSFGGTIDDSVAGTDALCSPVIVAAAGSKSQGTVDCSPVGPYQINVTRIRTSSNQTPDTSLSREAGEDVIPFVSNLRALTSAGSTIQHTVNPTTATGDENEIADSEPESVGARHDSPAIVYIQLRRRNPVTPPAPTFPSEPITVPAPIEVEPPFQVEQPVLVDADGSGAEPGATTNDTAPPSTSIGVIDAAVHQSRTASGDRTNPSDPPETDDSSTSRSTTSDESAPTNPSSMALRFRRLMIASLAEDDAIAPASDDAANDLQENDADEPTQELEDDDSVGRRDTISNESGESAVIDLISMSRFRWSSMADAVFSAVED